MNGDPAWTVGDRVGPRDILRPPRQAWRGRAPADAQSGNPRAQIFLLEGVQQRHENPGPGSADRAGLTGALVEALSGILRSGNAGSNTASDHIEVLTRALL